ncbi:YqjF family protein [Streptomyces sp. NPDC060194]|uniref:YqjF family protein n=1 Tax=Streptomyces sp. NPDC060194 TaxID=3347069 RepID=UPI0036480D9D
MIPPERVPPGPVTADAPREVARPLLTQRWLDLAFVHWPVEPELVAGLLPAGVRPDTLDGSTYVGLVAFGMHRIGWLGLPGVPYLGTFPETNVRLYSVDDAGRRGVVFRSLDASRLLPVLAGRALFGLPYVWSRMTVRHRGTTVAYRSTRRWPGPRGARADLVVRVGEALARPGELEHFVTARWGMHTSVLGRTVFVPNSHPRWPLHRAELLSLDENVVRAAGIQGPLGPPASVLYSPGVPVRFGRPAARATGGRAGRPRRRA